MSIEQSSFGEVPGGGPVHLFTLTNSGGLRARITNFGAILVSLETPNRGGRLDDVVLGFDSLDGYLENAPYFGATVGRVANRIAKARFRIGDVEYPLAANNGANHLHGGTVGFSKVVWTAEAAETEEGPAVQLLYLSPDGEEGYPGDLETTVVYTLTEADELKLEYTARADKPTPVNLTHHSYWNLAGEGSGADVLGHELTLRAAHYTPSGPDLIPTGEILPVEGTPMDFTKPAAIGARIGQLEGGYDHNFALENQDGSLAPAARVVEPAGGRVLEISTTEPGIQLYTANFLDGSVVGKAGHAYGRHTGFCLETQHFPDAVNQPGFPSIVLTPGRTYRQLTVHAFSTV